jgi:hypothetical protein
MTDDGRPICLYTIYREPLGFGGFYVVWRSA